VSWREPFSWPSYLLVSGIGLGVAVVLGLVTSLGALIVIGAGDALLRLALQGKPWYLLLFPGFILGLMTVGLVGLALVPFWILYTAFRIPKPDRLTFGDSGLRYEFEDPSRPRRQVRKIDRAELGGVRLEPVAGRQRLTIDHGAERLEVGKALRQPDRAWLASLLRTWVGEERLVPAGVPALPGNSWITAEADGEGRLTLRWKSRDARPRSDRWMGIAHLSVFLAIWATGEVLTIVMALTFLLGGVPGLELVGGFLLCWLTGWTAAGLVVLGYLWRLLRGPSEERVTLSPTALRHDPGRYFDGRDVCDGLSSDVPLAEVGAIRLERIEEVQRLTVGCGAAQIEFGPTLREPEREWLAQVLRTWVGQEERLLPPDTVETRP